jgi:response regulator of citrate/malate metabolism
MTRSEVAHFETEILIIDDNKQYTLVLKKMLEHVFGYQNITTRDSLESGYQTLKAEPERFKLLFVDYNFPSGETGGELLQRLQHEKLLADKVAFLVTSEPSVDNVKLAASVGAMGVLAKPFDREELERQLEKARRAFVVDSADQF